MTKASTPTEKLKKATWLHKIATKNFDYTTITDRLRTVSWSNNTQTTGVVKPVYERSHKNTTETITQRLRTDLGRLFEVTTATQLVWLNRFTGSQPSN